MDLRLRRDRLRQALVQAGDQRLALGLRDIIGEASIAACLDIYRVCMCLGQDDDADLRQVLRDGTSDVELEDAIREAISRKPKGHDFIIDRRHDRPAVARHMSVTGG